MTVFIALLKGFFKKKNIRRTCRNLVGMGLKNRIVVRPTIGDEMISMIS